MSEAVSARAAHAPFNELRGPTGAIRPHWQAFADGLGALSPGEFERRQAAARATVQDNGVTYNVYDDSAGRARPWELDIVPFILSTADWKAIEAAVIQRARLAELVLRDVYGEQSLVARGVLPPHLVLGHPQFLRPLSGVRPAGGVHVHLFSADLARAPDGSWKVMASRADAPAGLGYALENRIVVSQTFPETFADLRVSRLASFFNAYRETVLEMGHSRRDRAVLLTPGPYNEAYFEHVYLAHYLGLTLVQGDDLAVRDGKVFLKTLTGLERVSAIFRRVDSDFCDSLELHGDSELGVPGLVEAVRAGGVVLANALGGGVVESPALDAWLPNVCRALLGEELRFPDIDTVWCGTEWGRKEALARLPHAILRDAFDARPLFSRRSSARLGETMTRAEREEAAARIAGRGETLVVQEVSPLGLAPTFERGGFGARPLSLRVFAAFTANGWMVMPGGLARVTADQTAAALSMQSGASSKDAWVLSETPVDRFTLLSDAGKALEIRRQGESAPSRAMDNLFWLGRYAERSEQFVRILRAVAARATDEPGAALAIAGKLLLPFAGGEEASLPAPDGQDALWRQLQLLLYGRRHPHGLQRLLARVEAIAWSVRDRLSLDTWRTIHALADRDGLPEESLAFDGTRTRNYLDSLVRRLAAFSGLAAENMTRGPNFLFLELGRRIERAQHLAWAVHRTVGEVDAREADHIRIMLEIADSAMTYRSRYLNQVQVVPFVDLLLLDESNPRAAAFQIAAITHHLKELPRSTRAQQNDAPGAIAYELHRLVANAHPARLAFSLQDRRAGLVELTEAIERHCALLSDAIADTWFQHATRHRTGSAGWGSGAAGGGR